MESERGFSHGGLSRYRKTIRMCRILGSWRYGVNKDCRLEKGDMEALGFLKALNFNQEPCHSCQYRELCAKACLGTWKLL